MRSFFEASLKTDDSEDDLRELIKKVYKLEEIPNVKIVSQANLASTALEMHDEIVMAQMHMRSPSIPRQPSAEELVRTNRTSKTNFKSPKWAGESQKSASLMENDGMQESSGGEDEPGEVVNIMVSSKVAVPVGNSMPNLVAREDGVVVYAE